MPAEPGRGEVTAHDATVEAVDNDGPDGESAEEKAARVAAETHVTNLDDARDEVERLSAKADKEAQYLAQARDALTAAQAALADLEAAQGEHAARHLDAAEQRLADIKARRG